MLSMNCLKPYLIYKISGCSALFHIEKQFKTITAQKRFYCMTPDIAIL